MDNEEELPCLICSEDVGSQPPNDSDGVTNKLNYDKIVQCFLKLFKVEDFEGNDKDPRFRFCDTCKTRLGNLFELQIKLDELEKQITSGVEHLKRKMEKSEGIFESEEIYECYPSYRKVRSKIIDKVSRPKNTSVAMVTTHQKLAFKSILQQEPELDLSLFSPSPDVNEATNSDDDEFSKQPRKNRTFHEYPEKNLLLYGEFTFQLLESSDEKKGQVRCTLCDEMIPHNKGYIRRHVAKVHTDKFVCSLCPWRFPSASRLRFHVQGVHEGKPKKRRIVECKICARPISTGLRKQHEWSHKSKEEKEEALKDPKFAAEIPWSVLNSEKKYQCDKCEYRFTNMSGLKKHENRRHKDPSERRQLCPECGATVLNLRIHMRSQHGEDDGVVDLMKTCLEPGCGKKFLNLGLLTRHKNQVHKKLKPFECTQCGKCFGDKGNLKHHMEVVHKK